MIPLLRMKLMNSCGESNHNKLFLFENSEDNFAKENHQRQLISWQPQSVGNNDFERYCLSVTYAQ